MANTDKETALKNFEKYSLGIKRLKELEKELNDLQVVGFKKEVDSIRSKLKKVDAITQIEVELDDLKAKIRAKTPSVISKVINGIFSKKPSLKKNDEIKSIDNKNESLVNKPKTNSKQLLKSKSENKKIKPKQDVKSPSFFESLVKPQTNNKSAVDIKSKKKAIESINKKTEALVKPEPLEQKIKSPSFFKSLIKPKIEIKPLVISKPEKKEIKQVSKKSVIKNNFKVKSKQVVIKSSNKSKIISSASIKKPVLPPAFDDVKIKPENTKPKSSFFSNIFKKEPTENKVSVETKLAPLKKNNLDRQLDNKKVKAFFSNSFKPKNDLKKIKTIESLPPVFDIPKKEINTIQVANVPKLNKPIVLSKEEKKKEEQLKKVMADIDIVGDRYNLKHVSKIKPHVLNLRKANHSEIKNHINAIELNKKLHPVVDFKSHSVKKKIPQTRYLDFETFNNLTLTLEELKNNLEIKSKEVSKAIDLDKNYVMDELDNSIETLKSSIEDLSNINSNINWKS